MGNHKKGIGNCLIEKKTLSNWDICALVTTMVSHHISSQAIRKSVVKMQAYVRRGIAARKYLKLRRAVVAIQAFFRMVCLVNSVVRLIQSLLLLSCSYDYHNRKSDNDNFYS